LAAKSSNGRRGIPGKLPGENPWPSIGAIPPPPGYRRVPVDKNSFGAWLRTVSLKKDRTVYLYDGSRKTNQSAQFAVLDISVGKEDLQQCADAVMRLRAEYLYSSGDLAEINFRTGEGVWLNFGEWAKGRRYSLTGGHLKPYETGRYCSDRNSFAGYLRTVFSYCGTLSLEKQLIPIAHTTGIRAGDVWVKGGSPGHAMLVVELAINRLGRKVYLLAQSYMPAQDIHLVINPQNVAISPWYEVNDDPVYTPEWTFYPSNLRTWTNF
jgi:hypothetical protein